MEGGEVVSWLGADQPADFVVPAGANDILILFDWFFTDIYNFNVGVPLGFGLLSRRLDSFIFIAITSNMLLLSYGLSVEVLPLDAFCLRYRVLTPEIRWVRLSDWDDGGFRPIC
jgi:hypothetical protein